MKKQLFNILIVLLLFSCKHDLEGPIWDTEIIVPLVHNKMTINNILSDTNLTLLEDGNGFINLVYNERFINLDLDTLIKIDAIADKQTHTLDSASFDDVIIADTSTIGETITQIQLGTLLLPNGSTSSIPSLPNIANGDTIDIDASDYFETMTLYQGMLIISLFNGYPTDISNVSLSLINAQNQNTIATFYFALIPSGGNVSDSVSIAGQILDENLFAILNNMDVNASNGPVLIDYSDAIITTIKISNIGITEATAIFPEQQLTETLKEHTFDLGSAELEEIGIREGTVTVNVLSTLPNGKMIYNIPSLSKNGIPFTTGEMLVPQATSDELTSFAFNFDGYILDLTGEEGRVGGDTVNTIYTESYTFIDYTGNLESINNTDSFYSFVEFDLKTEYAKGYMGQDTIQISPEEKRIDIFNNINASNLELNEANFKIKIDNYIGADLEIDLIELKGKNDETNNEVILINNQTIEINRASLSNNNLPINKTTSELIIPAEEFINILPNNIISSANIYINPSGQSNIQDFLYPQYPIEGNISIDIPLSLIAEDLSFIDTTEINFPDNNESEIERLYLEINNDFPFETDINIILLDANNLVVDTILNNKIISAAQVDENNILIQSSSTNMEIEYTNFESIEKMVAIANFNTKPINEFINIYSYYELNINLSAKITKKIGK